MSAAPVEFDPTARVDRTTRLDPAPASDSTQLREPTEWLADGCRLTATGVAPIIPLRARDPQGRARARVAVPPRHRRAGTRGPRYAVQQVPAGAAQEQNWALSRRGELLIRRVTAALVLLAVIGVVTALAVGVAGLVAPSGNASRTVVVQPGQSLWQIARAADPDADVRDTVERIRTLNALPGADVQAGQQLIVPSG